MPVVMGQGLRASHRGQVEEGSVEGQLLDGGPPQGVPAADCLTSAEEDGGKLRGRERRYGYK